MFLRALVPVLLIGLLPLASAPIVVHPVHPEGFAQSLNGDWSFKYIAGNEAGADADFTGPAFDVSTWKTIRVPGNWELQGFSEPMYEMQLVDGLGLYRRTFSVPASWLGGRRICLRLEGVAFGFEAWVNGIKVGQSVAGAYNPHTFDITDALKNGHGAENVLAVQVTTKPHGFEFDVNDDWMLSGIYRDVTLFSVPATHVQGIATSTRLGDGGEAELSVSVSVSEADGQVRGRLFAPDGKLVDEFDLPRKKGAHAAIVRVARPQLWTAETPSLYRLHLSLSAKSEPLQVIEQRIGLREITIKDQVLLLNDRPIKLRGANHHDLDPVDGRAITEGQLRRDLAVMKQGNMNFLRTSHYPPQPRLLELCDELGIYVMDEVAIGKGEELQNNPAYRETIMARTEATLARDKNHASVIVWSIGNENLVTDQCLDAGRLAKEIDPSRPICYPMSPIQFDDDKQWEELPDFVDIYAPHYLTNQRLREFSGILKRPVILTEYAHALGLATERVYDQWEIIQATPHFAGGAIWHLMDQGLLRTSSKQVDLGKPAKAVWLDANRYYDTCYDKGQDGIVYSDRTPQTDFWETRKVYAPVQIAERSASVQPDTAEIALTVENRHDFRSLDGMKLAWKLLRNGATLQDGELPLTAPSHEKEIVRIRVAIPADGIADVLALDVRCLNEAGTQITERSVRLDLPKALRISWPSSLPSAGALKVTQDSNGVKIAHPEWTLSIERSNGQLKITTADGRLLVSGLYPHAGRRLTRAEHFNGRKNGVWRVVTLTDLKEPKIAVTPSGSGVKLTVSGCYPRPDSPEQAFVGGYQADVSGNGAIVFRYDFKPENAKGALSEAGLSLVVPAGLTEFRWIGDGPYAGYPGKDRLNEFGVYHLNRADLRFQGNRRRTELALLTTPEGTGVAFATAPGDIAIEIDGDKTFLKHNAVISSLGNKIGDAETLVDSAKTERIAGSFTLVPIGSKWPDPLIRWFGAPSAAKDVFKPFYHSYDQ